MSTVVSAMQTLRSEAGRADPFPIYAELHKLGAVCAVDDPAERYQFVVHGYDAVNHVLRDPAYRVTDAEMLERGGLRWREHPSLVAVLTSMFFTNEPRHARLRGMYSRIVTSRRVNALRGQIVAIVDDLLARMAERGAGGEPLDFMAEFAFPMPGNVICEMMGVPDGDRSWFIPRAHIFGDLLDLGKSSAELLRTADEATVELTEYFGKLIALRQKDPRDDMISGFAQLQATAERIPEPELLASLLTFFNAGFASTSHLLGNGVPLLAGQPRTIEAIQRDDVAARHVEEILRVAPPTHMAVRVTGEDRTVAGLTMPAGSLLLVLLAAANHDPARFPDPGRFDPNRPDNRPLTFGAGAHFCLGAPLTRLEGQVAFPMLFDRFPKLAPVGEATKTNRLTLSGYQTLPVALS